MRSRLLVSGAPGAALLRSTSPTSEPSRCPCLSGRGDRDALFPPPSGRRQAALFTGSERATFQTLGGTAHALTFEQGRRALQRQMDAWPDGSGR